MSGISITFWMSSEVNLKLESEPMGTMLAQLTKRQPNPPYNRGRKGLSLSTDAALFATRVQANLHILPKESCIYCL